MEKIRSELGSEALIVSSRLIRAKGIKGFFRKKCMEVVAAYEPSIQPQEPGKTDIKSVKKGSEPASQKIDQLYEKLDDLQSAVQDLMEQKERDDRGIDLPVSSKLKRLYDRLIENDVWENIAKDILGQAQQVSKITKELPENILYNVAVQRIGQPAALEVTENKPNVVMLMGPTGVGKTTTLVKLAGKYLLQEGRTVGIINTDTYRIAAQEQLRTYADIMGIPIHTVYKPEELDEALQLLQDKQVILIDTAGKSSYDEQYRRDLAEYIERSHADEILLLLSVTTGFRSAKEIITNYAFVQDYKLCITKVDEVKAWGGVMNIAFLAKKPIAYLTIGQNVPDDIKTADAEEIADSILGRS